MLLKAIVILLFMLVFFGLFRSLYFLVSQKGDKKAVVRSLTVRVTASAAILVLLAVAKLAGWMEPHTLQQPLRKQAEKQAEQKAEPAEYKPGERRRIEDEPALQ